MPSLNRTQDACVRCDTGELLDFAEAPGRNTGGVCTRNLMAAAGRRVMSEIALDVRAEQRMVDLHAFIDDADDYVDATACPVPGALDPKPIERGAEAALADRLNHHDLLLRRARHS